MVPLVWLPALCLLESGDYWSLLYLLRAGENSIPSSKASPVFVGGSLGGPLPGFGEGKALPSVSLEKGKK